MRSHYRDLLSALAEPQRGADDLAARIRTARDFVERSSADDVLAALCPNEALRREIGARLVRPEHVGLLAGPLPEAEIRDAATRGGFPSDQVFFPSVMVARELGAIAKRESVPTMIFRGNDHLADGHRVGVEIFSPQIDEDTLHSWTRARIGQHVAIEMVSGSDAEFTALTERFAELGFRIPTFIVDRPWIIPLGGSRKLHTIYLDGQFDGARCRVEVFKILS